jgi:predicted amidophosphoribosyltransferase
MRSIGMPELVVIGVLALIVWAIRRAIENRGLYQGPASKTCPHCGQRIPDLGSYCPLCGQKTV